MAEFAFELILLGIGGLALAVILEIVRGRKENRRQRELQRRIIQNLS